MLLPIVARRVMVRANGEIIDYELHSPYASVQTTDRDKCGSERVRLGAPRVTIKNYARSMWIFCAVGRGAQVRKRRCISAGVWAACVSY